MLLNKTVILLSLIAFISHISCSNPLIDAVQSRYNSEFRYVQDKDKWFIKIDDKYKITRSSIERDRKFLISWFSNPDVVKKNLNDKKLKGIYLEKTLNQNLIIIKALEEGALDSDDFDQYLWISIRDAMVHYYLKKRMESEKPDLLNVKINSSEVESVYKKYRDVYSAMGLDQTRAKTYIRETLIKEKRSLMFKRFESSVINKLKLSKKIEFSK